ncbi:MAG: MBL fold metallo-hydrolase, partial [Chloroflexota bacterium]
LIDCGLDIDESWDALKTGLSELGTTPDAIHTVVVTHGHHDHAGQAARLNRDHAARVWMHESDWAYIRMRYVESESFRAMLVDWLQRYGMPADVSQRVTRSLGQGAQSISTTQPDRLVSGGETLEVGDYRFEIVWTPGHTPGHVCLLEPTHKLLLSGDHILPGVHSNVSLQPYSTVNPLPGYLASLQRLADLPIRLTMPGHGDLMASVAERAHQLTQHQLHRRERLNSLLTEEARSPYQLADQVWARSQPRSWDQFPDHLRRNAVGTLVAHLEQLADEGLVRRVEDDGVVRFAARG